MNFKILIIFSIVILLNICLSKQAATKPKATTTKNAKTSKTTLSVKTEAPKPVAECYQSFRGYYENKYYNVSSPSKCATNCFAYKESLGTESQEAGSCNEDGSCLGSVFVVKYNYTFAYTCCESNLCNSPAFVAKNLNYKCEFGKQVPKTMKLKFPVRNLKASSSKQCYYCAGCTSASSAKVVNCAERNNTIKSFACMHTYGSKGTTNYWNGDCVSTEDMVMVSYEKLNSKVVTCQGDLCNSPAAVKQLSAGILCTDGFYF